MENNGNRLPIVEALIMSSPDPLQAKRISDVLEGVGVAEIDDIVKELNERYEADNRAFRIRKIAGGYQFYINENFSGYVEELYTRRKNSRLTRSALETLSIIAYRQPVTKLDIEMIRGVASDSVLHTLLERKLITLAGRAQTLGRPLLYRTTDEFLKYFGLNSLEDLPKMEEIEELVSSKDYDSQATLPFEKIPGEDDVVSSLNNKNFPGGDDETDFAAEEPEDESAAAEKDEAEFDEQLVETEAKGDNKGDGRAWPDASE
jgi:segregation and condensation protein B